MKMADDGSLSGTVEEKAIGHHAAEFRGAQKRLSKADFRKRQERWISETGPGASVDSNDTPAPVAGDDSLIEVTTFKTPRYAKLMQGSLLVVKSGVLPAHGVVNLSDPKRKYPVLLDSESFEETLRMKLPSNFELDELPRAVTAKAPFGNYSFSCEMKEGFLTCKRSLIVSAGLIQVEQYKEAREFFGRVSSSGDQPAVLQKK